LCHRIAANRVLENRRFSRKKKRLVLLPALRLVLIPAKIPAIEKQILGEAYGRHFNGGARGTAS
jgi:hypothetical protein